MKATYKKYIFDFKHPSGTSRGVLTKKETWFLIVNNGSKYGIGECGLLKGLSFDDTPLYEEKLSWVCENISLGKDELLKELVQYPSIQFGVEQAFMSIAATNSFELFPSDFTQKESPISINGLIWMGDEAFMHEQLQNKLLEGFKCIKMKIGAVDFDTEISILKFIRNTYSKNQIEIRVDANGAFSPKEALSKLNRLAALDIHSIEQPIRQGNFKEMKRLCRKTPIDIALDEELIGVTCITEKEELLQTIQPQFIILKPSLVGGFKGSQEWINLAEKLGIGWWVTSALESNVGLNAIAQWTYTFNTKMPQGLGTGSLFTNNLTSPLNVEKGALYYKQDKNWKTNLIEDLCI